MSQKLLTELIAENPQLPVIFIISNSSGNFKDDDVVALEKPTGYVGEYLNHRISCDERHYVPFTNRETFEEYIREGLSEELFQSEIEKFNRCWEPCIIVSFSV